LACGLAAWGVLPPTAQVVVDNVRVQAYSETLLRVEPRGPTGAFEDRHTFMVAEGGRDRFGAGAALSLANRTRSGAAWLTTAAGAALYLEQSQVGAVRELRLYAPAGQEAGAAPALLYSCKEGLLGSGCAAPDANHLAWPAPLAQPAYALVDHPRFVPPSWGAAAAPADAPAPADPALAATSQYDFRNNVAGYLYLFVFRAATSAAGTAPATSSWRWRAAARCCPTTPGAPGSPTGTATRRRRRRTTSRAGRAAACRWTSNTAWT
jgi:hypothetical protein